MSVEDQDGAPGAETSLRDDLASAMNAIKEREAAPAAAANEDAPPAADKPEADDKPARSDGRNERGQFAGKPKEAEEAPAAEAKPAEQSDAPKSLRPDEVAEWAGTPVKVREAFLRREKEISALVGRQDTERQFGKEVADIIRPYHDDITRSGATPQQALQVLFTNHKLLNSNNMQEKVDTARRLLHSYGINPALLAQPDPRFPQDPHMLAIMREVESLRAQVARPQQQQQYAPLPQGQEDGNVVSDIEAFRSDPAHPHFEQVSGHMAALIESGAAPDLESAYQMAVLAQPALRSTPQAAPALETQRSEHAAAARRAAVSVQGSPGAAGNPRPATLRDELREQLRAAGFGR